MANNIEDVCAICNRRKAATCYEAVLELERDRLQYACNCLVTILKAKCNDDEWADAARRYESLISGENCE